MIQLKNVTLRRSAKVLLDAASVTINPGEKVGLVGRNGAGKSTLTNLLTGDLPATSGHVALNGQDITGWTPEKISRHGLGRS